MKINIPFMKIIVFFSIGYVVYITERSMSICERIGISPESVYMTAVAFFGTELAMTMTKKILEKKKRGGKKNDES